MSCWNAINITCSDVLLRDIAQWGRGDALAARNVPQLCRRAFYREALIIQDQDNYDGILRGCGCDLDGKEKKNRLLLRGPGVNPAMYSIPCGRTTRKLLEVGSSFEDHLHSEHAYLCRSCKDLLLKLSSIQSKFIAERITKAVVAIEGCKNVNNK